MQMPMKTSDFDYDLPKRFIAQKPVEPRDSARLMVLRLTTGTIDHRIFRDLPALLSAGDVLVLNDTRVVPARLFARRETGGAVALLLLREIEGDSGGNSSLCEALVEGHGRVREGESLLLTPPALSSARGAHRARPGACGDPAMPLRLVRRDRTGKWVVELPHARVADVLARFGSAPMPPYIKREFGGGLERDDDLARYQTTFARHDGSIAAPTAGLHFTPELLARLNGNGVVVSYLTLHVGLGTFKPVTAERPEDHRMEPERYVISAETAEAVNSVYPSRKQPAPSTSSGQALSLPKGERAVGPSREHEPAVARETKLAYEGEHRIVAVGTTVCRTLEHAASSTEFALTGRLPAGHGSADLFIYPPFTFRAVDVLLTNFHLPCGTPLMLACAFAGRELILHSYEVAKKEGYRFYSYGDAMLIL